MKGETEIALAEMRRKDPTFHATSIRPCFIDDAEHGAIKSYVPAISVGRTLLAGILGPPIRAFAKGSWSPTEPLGKFMAELAMGKWEAQLRGEGVETLGEFSVIQNVGFRRLAGLDKK